ncbi:LuxR family transcriptional regulator [Poseidonocella sp. HB161398]|uniref:helix-turn-helix transcriptional regulator n=1 Tax=Poseidonocella sp. HB161398 TaxID=2320855 RepID=UPI001108B3EB|nr:LuxR family transcriptional regulator [Poseidonocella sp. HB161398]
MDRKLESLIGRLQEASSRADLQDAVCLLRDHYGVDHVVYHSVNQSEEPYAALTYGPDWVERYIEKDYARIDPVVQGCYQRFQPVDWKQLDWSSRAARSFLGEAISAGVGNQGLSVPIRGPNGQFAMFTVSARAGDDSWHRFTAGHLGDLLLIAHYMNQKALEFGNAPERVPGRQLSPREVDALSLLANGHSRGQASETLGISEHTLRVYIEAARLKLGAQNTTHAVALALSHGLIIL